jgi:hypothetical protein
MIEGNSMPHLVLLGDSIFDNAAYVPGGPAVIEQVRRSLPADWQATLLAVDGNVARDVSRQLVRLPADATHLAISAGGNDALGHSSILMQPANSVRQVLCELADIRDQFRGEFREMLQAVLARRLPTVVLTIYDAIPGLEREAQAALALFNEIILFEAAKAGVAVLDLRVLCRDPHDFAATSPIEPSVAGGAKIAAALAHLLTMGEVQRVGCRVWTS